MARMDAGLKLIDRGEEGIYVVWTTYTVTDDPAAPAPTPLAQQEHFTDPDEAEAFYEAKAKELAASRKTMRATTESITTAVKETRRKAKAS